MNFILSILVELSNSRQENDKFKHKLNEKDNLIQNQAKKLQQSASNMEKSHREGECIQKINAVMGKIDKPILKI